MKKSTFFMSKSFPGGEDPNVNYHELDGDDEESEWEDERNERK